MVKEIREGYKTLKNNKSSEFGYMFEVTVVSQYYPQKEMQK